MCSTPFGIKDDGTNYHPRDSRPSGGAQRLSASKMTALGSAIDIDMEHRLCSTPFGIKDDGTPDEAAMAKAEKMCSTPFGIKDDGTRAGMGGQKLSDQCSTPFGIKDDGTSECRPDSPAVFSAQRLSASKMTAPPSAQGTPSAQGSAQRLSASKMTALCSCMYVNIMCKTVVSA